MHVVKWVGESGATYDFELLKITDVMPDDPCCYVFMKTDGDKWEPIYPPGGEAFRETDNLLLRMEKHPNAKEIIDNGATHVGVHSEPNRHSIMARRFIVRDLNATHMPDDTPF